MSENAKKDYTPETDEVMRAYCQWAGDDAAEEFRRWLVRENTTYAFGAATSIVEGK